MSYPNLPPYIFLMSDHTTKQLAVDVADALAEKYPAVYIDDFLAPIHEAYTAMFELDWKRDMGNPEVVSPDTNDMIVSLERWFIDQFGATKLGEMARQRSDARNHMADYITVYRDATANHIIGFQGTGVQNKIVILLPLYSVDYVLALIEGN